MFLDIWVIKFTLGHLSLCPSLETFLKIGSNSYAELFVDCVVSACMSVCPIFPFLNRLLVFYSISINDYIYYNKYIFVFWLYNCKMNHKTHHIGIIVWMASVWNPCSSAGQSLCYRGAGDLSATGFRCCQSTVSAWLGC